MILPFLAAWFIYLVVLSALLAASAGWRTALGRLSVVAGLASALLALALLRWPFGHYEALALGGPLLIAATGGAGLAAGRREDTRLIALMLLAAAAVPLAIAVWRPGA